MNEDFIVRWYDVEGVPQLRYDSHGLSELVMVKYLSGDEVISFYSLGVYVPSSEGWYKLSSLGKCTSSAVIWRHLREGEWT